MVYDVLHLDEPLICTVDLSTIESEQTFWGKVSLVKTDFKMKLTDKLANTSTIHGVNWALNKQFNPGTNTAVSQLICY